MLLIQYGHTTTDPATAALAIPTLYLGAALYGIATALTLPTRPTYHLVAAAPLALIAVILATANATGTLGVLYALAAAARWLTRLTQMTRRPNQLRPNS
jgi:hypothetical protein